MTHSAGDVDPFESLIAELTPETPAIAPVVETEVFDALESSKVLRLSIRENVFRKIGDTVEELGDEALRLVILKAAPVSRMYYSEAYTEGKGKAPTCWSTDAGTGVPAPPVLSQDRQSPTCFNCPQNIKGSGNGSSRACRFQQRLAVMLADKEGVLQPDQICQLTLPATSVFGNDRKKKGLQTYARLIDDQGALLSFVMTEINFDEGSGTPKICFRPFRVLEEEEIALIKSAQQDPNTKKLVTFNPNSYVDDSPSTDNVFSTVQGEGVYVKT
jgi:hypothetical protein